MASVKVSQPSNKYKVTLKLTPHEAAQIIDHIHNADGEPADVVKKLYSSLMRVTSHRPGKNDG